MPTTGQLVLLGCVRCVLQAQDRDRPFSLCSCDHESLPS